MFLRSVHLINWRSYRNARFEFPRPHGDKNVVLVMAPNEHGKTSFFEAVTLGLFGRDGLILVPSARAAAGNDINDRLAVSYSRFLKDALHYKAVETGRPECIVKLIWEDDTGDSIEIKRTWYFNSKGVHKVEDDQLDIYEGEDRAPVYPPVADPDREHWYGDWIAQRFLHPSLAKFFLFDGEEVQRYAHLAMEDQVRKGIYGLLGLPVLYNLKDSLVKYAQKQRTGAAPPSDAAVKAVEAEISTQEILIRKKTAEHDEADKRLPGLDKEIDSLTRRLGGKGEGTVALVASLMEDERKHEEASRTAVNNLMELVAGDIALAISGAPLRDETVACLKAEAKREAWEAGRNEGSRNLDRFTADLSERIGLFEPPVDAAHREAVIAAVRAAWESLWHPLPEGCADSYLHAGLTGAARAATIDHLAAVGRHSAAEAPEQVRRFQVARSTADAKRRERLELERIAPELEKLTADLKTLSQEHGKYAEQRDAARRAIEAAEGVLAAKRSELGGYMSELGGQAHLLRYAEQADAYARLIGDLLEEAVPSQVEEVADRMTAAWKAMAHMSDRVDRIEISPDCEVKMLAADGGDLHLIDKSSGASQVFAQALIVAITRVSGTTFPFIVDTPLARLSRDQRIGVLKTFTDRPGQAILLSTDEEVVEGKLDAIRNRIAASYELKVVPENGVAVTTVHDLKLRSV